MNDTFNGHLCIVFALEHYNPLNVIRELGKNGISPVYISVKRRYELAVKSRYISKLHKVDSVAEGFALLMDKYGNCFSESGYKPYILLSDDLSLSCFDAHFDEWKDRFVTFNAGSAGRINAFMDKYRMQQLAGKYGFKTLKSYVIGARDQLPLDLEYPVITKGISSVSGGGKADVHICNDEMELRDALQTIGSYKVLVQHFLDKENEMTLEGYSIDRGRSIHIIAKMTYKYLISGYYSPYHDVTMFTDVEMERKLQAMFEEIGFEGVFEVEFLVARDGTLYFMETNYRASAHNPVCRCAGMPLALLWMKGMENGRIDSADRKEFEPFTSMSEVIDYGKRVDGGMVPLAEWLRDFREVKCPFLYDKDDREPWDEVIRNWQLFK